MYVCVCVGVCMCVYVLYEISRKPESEFVRVVVVVGMTQLCLSSKYGGRKKLNLVCQRYVRETQ